MDDAMLVGFFQCFSNLLGDRERFVERNPSALQPLSQVLAVDQLQDQERLAVCLFETVDGGDVGVIEGG